jgi:hypothetical protein
MLAPSKKISRGIFVHSLHTGEDGKSFPGALGSKLTAATKLTSFLFGATLGTKCPRPDWRMISFRLKTIRNPASSFPKEFFSGDET